MTNEITITGRLGRDAELRFTPQGRPVLNFDLADSKSKPDGNNGWVEVRPTMWHRCTVWGALAEMWGNSGLLVKSAQVDVTGEISVEEYDRKDGTKGFATKIQVRSIGVREPHNNQSGGGGFSQPAQQQAPVNDPWSQDSQGGATGFESEPPF